MKKEQVKIKIYSREIESNVKKLLSDFGEKILFNPNYLKSSHNTTENSYYGFTDKGWQGLGSTLSSRRSLVTLPELKNILAKEHLQKGKIAVFSIKEYEYVCEFDEYLSDSNILISKYKGMNNSFEGNIGNVDQFERLASDEEMDFFYHGVAGQFGKKNKQEDWSPAFGESIEVSDDLELWHEGFIFIANNPIKKHKCAILTVDDTGDYCAWKFARKKLKKVTKEEAEKILGMRIED